MHVHKIRAQSKESYTEQRYKIQSVESTELRVATTAGEKRRDRPHLQGFFFFSLIFLADISVQ